MKLSIPKSELLRGLSRLQSIADKRNSMPILVNVLLDASGEQLHLAATDLEVGIQSLHAAAVESPGAVTASAKKLFEIVRELPEDDVSLDATANAYLQIVCGRSRFTLAGTAAEEYPSLPTISPASTVLVQAALLSTMIERTMYAASIDETRYNLNGVYVEVLPDSGKIRMVATDGHRLALADRLITDDASRLRAGVIIPRKGLAELKRLADEEDADEIELGFEGNSGLARKGSVTLVMRLIEGDFPNYRGVIPTDPGTSIALPSERLTHALRRAVLLSSERSRAVKFELSEGQLVLSSSNPDLGDSREELDVDYSGEPLTIGFNARYLLDALGALHAKEVRLALQNDLSPARLVPAGEEDTLAVVMPMRI